ncbi:MAG: FtsX-like permease family protein [Vicinamibacterales bacterium]
MTHVRGTLRSLRRSPAYSATLVTVVAMAIALGAATCTVVESAFLGALPFDRPEALHLVGASRVPGAMWPGMLSGREISAVQAQLPGLPGTVLMAGRPVLARVGGVDLRSAAVDARFLDVVGVRPALGGFDPGDFDWGPALRPPELVPVLITDEAWRTRFGRDPDIVGREVVIMERGERRTGLRIRGVLPPDFVFPLDAGETRADVIAASGIPGAAVWPRMAARQFQLLVRITPPRSFAEVAGALERAQATLLDGRPADPSRVDPSVPSAAASASFDLQPIGRLWGADERTAFRPLVAAAALLLLLTAVNVTGLVAARTIARRPELAIRRALGASARDIAWQLAGEIGFLMAIAALAAWWLARPLVTITLGLLPDSVTLLRQPAVDARALAVAIGLGVAVTLIVAVWPAVLATRTGRPARLASGASAGSRAGRRSAFLIVTTQTAFGCVLIVAGALTAVSLSRVRAAELGFHREDLAVVEVEGRRFRDFADVADQLRRGLDALREMDGVRAVAAASVRPFDAGSVPFTTVAPEGVTARPEGVAERRVDRAFFDVARLSVLEGALPTEGEWRDGAPVAVVSRTAARLLWPDRSALGQVLTRLRPVPGASDPRRIVAAVVGDARWQALDAPPVGDVYLPGVIQATTVGIGALVQTTGDASDVAARAARELTARGLTVRRAVALEDAMASSTRARVLPVWLFGTLGASALAIVAVGVVGLVTMTAAQRTRELVIRVALGATSGGVTRLLVRDQLVAVGAGLAVGLVASVWTARWVESQLYATRVYDLTIWAAAAGVLGLVAVAGATLPAVRAARVDPARLLKAE